MFGVVKFFFLLWGVVAITLAFTEPINECLSSSVEKMRANVARNAAFLLAVLFFQAFSAFPSRPDDRTLANNEYQVLKNLMPSLRQIIAEDKFIEEKRNQEVMSAFNNMEHLKNILRSG